MKQKGSVLAYVLVLAVVVMIISAGLARLMLVRSMATQRLADGISKTKSDDGSVMALVSAWTQSGLNQACDVATAATVGYTCAPGTAPCTCTCTKAGAATVGVKLINSTTYQFYVDSDQATPTCP
ncbi:MAG: hypothetical protein HY077_12475 [Elusimicrobia bacterium]|nr:hypothetical protein [Elusimicrobiota bacterium]